VGMREDRAPGVAGIPTPGAEPRAKRAWSWRHCCFGALWLLGSAVWGVSCSDCGSHAGEKVFLGNESIVLVVIGILLVPLVVLLFRRRMPTSKRAFVYFVVCSVGVLGGFLCHARVAGEAWNRRCAPETWPSQRACYHAAENLGFFRPGGEDLLGRRCVGSELPYIVCDYRPRRDQRSCDLVARECAARRAGLRRYATVDVICREWADVCAGRRPPSWPP
jgi:hypothetical protein